MAKKPNDNPNAKPAVTSAVPVDTARRLATPPDYLPSASKILSVSELESYNSILRDTSKEAADKWLTDLWA